MREAKPLPPESSVDRAVEPTTESLQTDLKPAVPQNTLLGTCQILPQICALFVLFNVTGREGIFRFHHLDVGD